MTDSAPRRSPAFVSKLPRVSLYELERMNPCQRQRREAAEEMELREWRSQQWRKPKDE
jgi:hypothetical protein